MAKALYDYNHTFTRSKHGPRLKFRKWLRRLIGREFRQMQRRKNGLS